MNLNLFGLGALLSVVGVILVLVHGVHLTEEGVLGAGVALLVLGAVWKGEASDSSSVTPSSD